MLAACAALMVSCAKDNGNDIEVNSPETIDNNATGPAFTGRTLTFSVEMDIPATTKAALDGLDIKWESGDSIGIATNNSATIVSYPVTNRDGTKGEITVNEVVGATDYYAIFRGSNATYKTGDFTGVTFNTETKTFSGLTVGNQSILSGSFNSHLYISNGYPLAMAGKTTGLPQSGHLIMKPCLALFRLGIASASVPAGYYYSNVPFTTSAGNERDHYYSAVRGFAVYQLGASTIYSSGDFNVQIGADGSLTTTAVSNLTEKREKSQSDKLSSGVDYYMCVIPGGSVSSFRIDFLGYKSNGKADGDLSWSPVYTMTKSGDFTVNPGDYYDLGTLNPLGRKKALIEAADEALDSTIDGDVSEWADIDAFPSARTDRIREWKYKSDSYNHYFYFKLRRNRVDGAKNLYIGLDLDNNNETGSSYGDVTGCEGYIKVVPFTNSGQATEPVPVNGYDSASKVYVSGVSDYSANVYVWDYDTGETLSSDSSNIYIEIGIPKSQLVLPSSGSISVGCSYDWACTGKSSVSL